MAPDIVAAGCVESVERTRVRLAALTKEAEVAVPGENWFGEPSAAKDVNALLDGAKVLAEDGKEQACSEQLEQAKAVLDGLESKANGGQPSFGAVR